MTQPIKCPYCLSYNTERLDEEIENGRRVVRCACKDCRNNMWYKTYPLPENHPERRKHEMLKALTNVMEKCNLVGLDVFKDYGWSGLTPEGNYLTLFEISDAGCEIYILKNKVQLVAVFISAEDILKIKKMLDRAEFIRSKIRNAGFEKWGLKL